MAARPDPARPAVPAPGRAPVPPGDDLEGPDDLWVMERALRRRGFAAVAGADEAGRGACAGPLVAAACVLPAGRRGRVPGLADSKLLSPTARERVYTEVLARAAAWSVVVVPVADLDARGMHVTNIEALRRAVCTLDPGPDYVLTDGFPVTGLARPSLAVWKGDRVAACVAAASVLAKVTRDRMMVQLHERWPEYDFAVHKGYITELHSAALDRHGPCPAHRMRFVNVVRARDALAARGGRHTDRAGMHDDGCMGGSPGGGAGSTVRWSGGRLPDAAHPVTATVTTPVPSACGALSMSMTTASGSSEQR